MSNSVIFLTLRLDERACCPISLGDNSPTDFSIPVNLSAAFRAVRIQLIRNRLTFVKGFLVNLFLLVVVHSSENYE